MASIFVLEYQGKNFLNYMETPSWNYANPVELSKNVQYDCQLELMFNF